MTFGICTIYVSDIDVSDEEFRHVIDWMNLSVKAIKKNRHRAFVSFHKRGDALACINRLRSRWKAVLAKTEMRTDPGKLFKIQVDQHDFTCKGLYKVISNHGKLYALFFRATDAYMALGEPGVSRRDVSLYHTADSDPDWRGIPG